MEMARSRALRQESERLMNQARSLRAEIGDLLASWPVQVERARAWLRATSSSRHG